jgi:DNA-binding LacI/PurR family transcriptional regulator
MKRPVTVRQIAERADVSIGTVSHVINGTARVRPKLRQRVLDAIRDLGFQPSALAQALRRNRTNILGMVISDITNPFFPEVVRGAEDVAYRNSYRMVLCNADNSPEKETSYLTDLRSFRVAGLLIIPAAGSELGSLLAGPSGFPPTVCLDRCPIGWTGDSVLAANEAGACSATRHLIQNGHRQLAVIAGPTQVPNAIERVNGFKKACAEAGLMVGPEYVQYAEFNTHGGFKAARRLLRMLPRPTAIFACNDLIALGVLHAAHELGLRCPEDLSLVGFDSLELCEYTSPALTSVYQPGYQLGVTGAELLLERISVPSEEPKHIVLQTELRVRSSVVPPEVTRQQASGKHGRPAPMSR